MGEGGSGASAEVTRLGEARTVAAESPAAASGERGVFAFIGSGGGIGLVAIAADDDAIEIRRGAVSEIADTAFWRLACAAARLTRTAVCRRGASIDGPLHLNT